jgi:menaquinone-dependent protoporphyrinogen IX oxidase
VRPCRIAIRVAPDPTAHPGADDEGRASEEVVGMQEAPARVVRRPPRILVAYATPGSEGQTELIAERLAATLRADGAEVDVADLVRSDGPHDLGAYDGVIVGGSVRGSRYRRSLHRFLDVHREGLARRRWALFSVCLMVAAVDPAARARAQELPRELARRHHVRPTEIAVLGGALRFSRHGRLGARVLYAVNRRALGRTRMEDWEYTDWDAVDALAQRMTAAVRESRARVSARAG